MTTEPEIPINIRRNGGWIRRLIERLSPAASRWEPIQRGPATIHTQRYKIIDVEIQGTYVLERDQHGEERYVVIEPDGTRYIKRVDQISMQTPMNL
jgi:hypothetical protein